MDNVQITDLDHLMGASAGEMVLEASCRSCFSEENHRLKHVWTPVTATIERDCGASSIGIPQAAAILHKIVETVSRPDVPLGDRTTTVHYATLRWSYLTPTGKRVEGNQSFETCDLRLDDARRILADRPNLLAALPKDGRARAIDLFDLAREGT